MQLILILPSKSSSVSVLEWFILSIFFLSRYVFIHVLFPVIPKIVEKGSAKRFWRKKQNAREKISIHQANVEHLVRKRNERSLLPLNARGKIRRKLINGIYESFCYSTRQAFEFQANDADEFRAASRPPLVVDRYPTPEKYPTHVCENLTTIDKPLLASPRSIHSEHLLSSSTWYRVNSWSTSASCTCSSGYSSANTSCPSSANSHRSSSPTPDFSNIKLLRATLEKYEDEEHSCSRESDLEILTEQDEIIKGDFYNSFATWPQKSKNQDKTEKAKKKVFSGKFNVLVFPCIFWTTARTYAKKKFVFSLAEIERMET